MAAFLTRFRYLRTRIAAFTLAFPIDQHRQAFRSAFRLREIGRSEGVTSGRRDVA